MWGIRSLTTPRTTLVLSTFHSNSNCLHFLSTSILMFIFCWHISQIFSIQLAFFLFRSLTLMYTAGKNTRKGAQIYATREYHATNCKQTISTMSEFSSSHIRDISCRAPGNGKPARNIILACRKPDCLPQIEFLTFVSPSVPVFWKPCWILNEVSTSSRILLLILKYVSFRSFQ